MGSAVAVVTPGADGIHLGERALYPGGLLLVVLVGSEPINTGGRYRRAKAGPRCGPARSSPPHAVPRTRAPRARSVHRSGNPALRKSRRRAPPARVPRGVKRRQSVTERPGSPRRKRPQLQQGDARSHTALEAPARHGSPAGAPLPMSRHALSYLQLTGAITPERASRIVVVSGSAPQRGSAPHYRYEARSSLHTKRGATSPRG